jgi:hypothetical protein
MYLWTLDTKAYIVLAVVAINSMIYIEGRRHEQDTQQETFNTKLATHKYKTCNDA